MVHGFRGRCRLLLRTCRCICTATIYVLGGPGGAVLPVTGVHVISLAGRRTTCHDAWISVLFRGIRYVRGEARWGREVGEF